MALILLLAVDEKEGLILSNGPTDRSAKLIQVELLRGGCEKALRVETGVAQKLKQRSVESVGSRFRGDQHRRARPRSVLRRVVIGEDLELLNGINRRQNSDAACRQFVVVVAVQEPIRAVCARSAHGKRKRPPRGDFAAGTAVKEAVGIRFLRRTRREGSELDEIASIQRKLRNLLGGDDLAERRICGLNGHFRGADFYLGGHRSWRQIEIQLALLIDLQANVFALHGLKTLKLHAQRVIRYRQQGDEIVPRVVGLRLARCTRALGNGLNRHPGDDRSGFVRNRPGKTAPRLSVHERRDAKPNRTCHRRPQYFLAHHRTLQFLLWFNG